MDRTRALSFGARAQEYQRSRPDYPAALLDQVLEPAWTAVADVGAGTGKLTKLLCDRGLTVTAVEPDAGMRSVLAGTAPAATVLAGTGEAIPLPERSVDAVTYAQAWHWVDPDLGFREAARVLSPGGSLVLIWNTTGEEPWALAVDELTHSGAHVSEFDEVPSSPLFEPAQRHEVAWSEPIGKAQLVERATTWSAVATLPDDERSALLEELRALLDTHPDTRGRDPLELPHVTLAFSYRLR